MVPLQSSWSESDDVWDLSRICEDEDSRSLRLAAASKIWTFFKKVKVWSFFFNEIDFSRRLTVCIAGRPRCVVWHERSAALGGRVALTMQMEGDVTPTSPPGQWVQSAKHQSSRSLTFQPLIPTPTPPPLDGFQSAAAAKQPQLI